MPKRANKQCFESTINKGDLTAINCVKCQQNSVNKNKLLTSVFSVDANSFEKHLNLSTLHLIQTFFELNRHTKNRRIIYGYKFFA